MSRSQLPSYLPPLAPPLLSARLALHVAHLGRPTSAHLAPPLPPGAPRGPPGAPSCSCFLRCLSRLVCCPKHRLHRWHLKGFSLLWMFRTCRWRLEEMLKERSQYLHLEDRRTGGGQGLASTQATT